MRTREDATDCPPALRGRRLSGLRSIARAYVDRKRARAQAELAWFRVQPSLRFTIELAALAVNSGGKRYSHQTRLKRVALLRAEQVLVANERRLAAFTTFDELITFVDALLEPIDGLGELYTYDTALRIGAKLELLPVRVYLHRGTRAGARALGLDAKARALPRNKLPSAWSDLPAHEIEDILCIFKDRFARGRSAVKVDGRNRRSWCD